MRDKNINNYHGITWQLEYDMCKSFWKSIKQYEAIGHIHEFDIAHVSNNQNTSNVRSQARDKAIGTVAGVADYAVSADRWLEAKIYRLCNNPTKKDGTYTQYIEITQQSDRQIAFEKRVIERGGKYEIFYHPDQGLEILRKWGVLKKL